MKISMSLVVIAIVVYVIWQESQRTEGSVKVQIGEPTITHRTMGNT